MERADWCRRVEVHEMPAPGRNSGEELWWGLCLVSTFIYPTDPSLLIFGSSHTLSHHFCPKT